MTHTDVADDTGFVGLGLAGCGSAGIAMCAVLALPPVLEEYARRFRTACRPTESEYMHWLGVEIATWQFLIVTLWFVYLVADGYRRINAMTMQRTMRSRVRVGFIASLIAGALIGASCFQCARYKDVFDAFPLITFACLGISVSLAILSDAQKDAPR